MLVLFLLTAIVSKAQFSPAYQSLRDREMQRYQMMRGGGGENTNDAINGVDYDLVYARMELRLNPDTSIGKHVRGAITTYFKTVNNNFTRINFDMANILSCDSVYYHGVKLPAGNIVKQADTLRITLPAAIAAAGTLDSIKVFYQGVPPQVPTWTTTGFYRAGTAGSTAYIHTLSEPYSAYTWWPSKARIAHDKFDSVDIIISTPSAFKVAANGKRISEPVSGAHRITTYQNRYPISTYQICLGVARYTQYPAVPQLVNIGGTNMELYNLLWSGSTYSTVALDRTADMLQVMSNSFSDYPFKNEKYGHYTFGFGGGMEHNTFSGMGTGTMDQDADWSVIAHELGHQWWGAAVTCGSWRDIWVNESFARYSEVIYLEGKTATGISTTPQQHRAGFKKTAIAILATNQGNGVPDEPIYQADTSNMSAIFSPAVYIYERGAMFVSMLRKTVGDAKFFQALKNYQLDPTLRYKNAYSADVERHFEAVSGLDLTEMFQDWLHRSGHPSYTGARWNNAGGQVVIYLPQTRVTNTYSTHNNHFSMPVVLRLRKTSAPARDTTIVLFDRNGVLYRVSNDGVHSASSGGNIIQVGISFTPESIEFDPLSETLALPDVGPASTYTPATIVKDAGLALLATKIADFAAYKDGKNAKLSWQINHSVDYASFEIQRSTDAASFTTIGTLTADQNPGAISFNQTDFNIPAGLVYYRIKIIEKDGSSFYTKVVTVNNKLNESFIVSPNPATDHIMISHTSSSSVSVNIKITDAAGKVVKAVSKQTIATGNKLRIPLENFAAGTYYVEIEGAEYFKVTRKIALIK